MNSMTSTSNNIVIRFVWPVDLLETVIARRTAIVVTAERLSDFEHNMIASGRAISLAKSQIELFVLIGRDAERSHDCLDCVLERSGIENVVTTYHGNDELEDAAALVAASAQATGIEQIIIVIDPLSSLGIRMHQFLDEYLPTK